MKTNLATKSITVNSQKKYQVVIGKGILDNIYHLTKDFLGEKVALVTDDIVDSLYSNKVINALESQGKAVFKLVIPNGEKSKNIDTLYKIVRFLAQNEFTRKDTIIALGGGVVGDISGFSASVYLRGINYIQVPTTLLAQIDSSVGGKTAIDIPEGKNLVGSFYQPSLVVVDIDTLSSLPNAVYLDGMGEGVKYALLDAKIFDIVNKKDFDILEFVYACIKYKADIVEMDEFESGQRKLLNLGHTIAHGIEKLSEFNISHGKAVSMGLKVICQTSFNRGLINQKEKDDILSMLDNTIGNIDCPFDLFDILKIALVDKKRKGNSITLVLIGGIGKPILKDLPVSELTEYFS
ncbi:MAG: 3-dehydroquinate synthase [Clostridiales bacterium]|nr:3-dehydroquinate synthase [Clostridiales bacterium]